MATLVKWLAIVALVIDTVTIAHGHADTWTAVSVGAIAVLVALSAIPDRSGG